MHDGVQYGPIQGQGQGYEPLKVGNPAISRFSRQVATAYLIASPRRGMPTVNPQRQQT